MKSFLKFVLRAWLPVLPATAGVFTFDGPGGLANDYASAGVSFHPAVLDFAYTPAGDPIPGTETWRIDAGAPAVSVDNPADFGRGAAPSPALALNALFQPVLVQLTGTPQLLQFSLQLDGDSFGQPDAQIEFYGAGNSLLGVVSLDQTIPGLSAGLAGPLTGVDHVVLPAGAFYDNLNVTTLAPVPEPAGWASGFGVLLLAGGVARTLRRRASTR